MAGKPSGARRGVRTLPLAAVLLFGAAVNAADDIDEVSVTATKRESTIQDVPFSINAQTQQDIQRSGADSLEDLSRNVAGLAIQNLGPGQSQVAIRGVSAGQIIRDQPGVKEQVGVYIDESVISLSLFTPDFDLYDLNRVETLRGPQGTLFGSGSIGGTIRYITNPPDPNGFEAAVEVNANSIGDGGTGGHVKGMLNIPISETVALRAVGYTTEYGGYIDAFFENGSRKDDVNSGSRNGGRVAVSFTPSDALTITPRIIYQEIETDGLNRQEVYNLYANPFTTTRPPVTFREREQHLLLREGFSDETLLADLVVEKSFESFDLAFVGSYTDRDILVSRDASALTGSVSLDIGLPDSAVLLPSNLLDTTELEQTTYELRFSSNTDSALGWVVGAFSSDTDRNYMQRLPTPGYDAAADAVFGPGASAGAANGVAPPDSPFASDLPYNIEQFALFGELTFQVNDQMVVTAGARYYDFEEIRDITFGGLFPAPADPTQTDKTTSNGINPRILISYELNEAVTLNAQASQGFRLGGVNDPLNTGLCQDEDVAVFGGFQDYAEETLWNYEAGIKARLDDGLTLNAAIFYADMKDLQVTLDAGTCSSRISFNVEDAHSSGAEFELVGTLADSFEYTLAGSLVTSEFDTTVIDALDNVLGGVESGNRLASVPEFQIAATGSYYFPMLGGEGYLSASVQHVGDRITQPSDQVPGAGEFTARFTFGGASGSDVTSLDLELDAYTIVNLSAGWSRGTWEAVLYLKNLGDESANLSFDRERNGDARLAYRTNQPRTIGATLRKRFGN